MSDKPHTHQSPLLTAAVFALCVFTTCEAAELQLKDGRVLKDCQLVAIEGDTVIVKHGTVIEGVPRDQVPAAALVQFRLDQEKSPGVTDKKSAKTGDEAHKATAASNVVLVEGTLLETRSDGLRIVRAELPPEVLSPEPAGAEERRRWKAVMDKFSAEKTMRIKGRVALRGAATVQERWISANAVRQGEITVGKESLPLYVSK